MCVKFYVHYQYSSSSALTLHLQMAAALHYYWSILDSVLLPT